MKKNYFTLLTLVFLIGCNVFAQTPVVYYPLNGNAIDSSAKGLHGRVQNCTPVPDRFGRPNGALQLNTNGVNDKSKIILPTPDINGFYSEVFSYSIWVKVPHYGSMPLDQSFALFKMGNTFGSTHDLGVTNAKSISTKGFNGGSSNLNSKTNYSVCYASSSVDSTKWYHLVLVRDTGNIRLYINGALKTTSTILSSKPKYTKGDSTAGCNLDNALSLFAVIVELDELRIFDKVLSTSEIAALYTPAPVNSGINNILEESKFRIYPNPSKGNMQLDYEMAVNNELANVTIYDLDGRELLSNRKVLPQENIDISNLSKGLYFVYIKYNEQTITKKIEVE